MYEDEKSKLEKVDSAPGPSDVAPVESITYEDEGAEDGRNR